MRDDLTGPALINYKVNWENYPRKDLYDWIRNSQALIASGHPQAVKLWKEWEPRVMNNFLNFTDEDIEAVLAYIDDASL